MTNELAGSTSTYLQQHAHQPVAWREWSEDAFDEARRRDLPLFVSSGYAACHWCHVMAHESFEDEEVAAYLSDNFICLKVDREERPDIDSFLMSAAMVVNGHGGWPLSVFLTPEGRPFFAGTYFPPADRHGQVGFLRLLQALSDAWRERREEVNEQALAISHAQHRELRAFDGLVPTTGQSPQQDARGLEEYLMAHEDPAGGFSGAPKFPRADYLLACESPDTWPSAARFIESMMRGGLYDHIGGGVARYSVDATWRVPHFEKMLVDQALLVDALRVQSVRQGRPEWRELAHDIIRAVQRDFSSPDGYCTALDADAGGEEGSHITWTPDEVRDVVGSRAPEVLSRWNITDRGDLDGRSVPHLAPDVPLLTPPEFLSDRAALFAARQRRPQPQRDNSVVLEANAMLAYSLCGDSDYVEDGLSLLRSLHRTHHTTHWWRTSSHRARATSSDVAWLTLALVRAGHVAQDTSWWEGAIELGRRVIADYWDGDGTGGGFFVEAHDVTDVPLRQKDFTDGATPSGQGLMTLALAQLALVSEDPVFGELADINLARSASTREKHPSAVPTLIEAARWRREGTIIVALDVPSDDIRALRSLSVPRSFLVTDSQHHLSMHKSPGLFYVCRGSECLAPLHTPHDIAHAVASWQ